MRYPDYQYCKLRIAIVFILNSMLLWQPQDTLAEPPQPQNLEAPDYSKFTVEPFTTAVTAFLPLGHSDTAEILTRLLREQLEDEDRLQDNPAIGSLKIVGVILSYQGDVLNVQAEIYEDAKFIAYSRVERRIAVDEDWEDGLELVAEQLLDELMDELRRQQYPGISVILEPAPTPIVIAPPLPPRTEAENIYLGGWGWWRHREHHHRGRHHKHDKHRHHDDRDHVRHAKHGKEHHGRPGEKPHWTATVNPDRHHRPARVEGVIPVGGHPQRHPGVGDHVGPHRGSESDKITSKQTIPVNGGDTHPGVPTRGGKPSPVADKQLPGGKASVRETTGLPVDKAVSTSNPGAPAGKGAPSPQLPQQPVSVSVPAPSGQTATESDLPVRETVNSEQPVSKQSSDVIVKPDTSPASAVIPERSELAAPKSADSRMQGELKADDGKAIASPTMTSESDTKPAVLSTGSDNTRHTDALPSPSAGISAPGVSTPAPVKSSIESSSSQAVKPDSNSPTASTPSLSPSKTVSEPVSVSRPVSSSSSNATPPSTHGAIVNPEPVKPSSAPAVVIPSPSQNTTSAPSTRNDSLERGSPATSGAVSPPPRNVTSSSSPAPATHSAPVSAIQSAPSSSGSNSSPSTSVTRSVAPASPASTPISSGSKDAGAKQAAPAKPSQKADGK